MAQLTPNDILQISEPIEAIYQRTVDELLINIAHHFNISGWERTRYWEIKKLSEMGALTKESAAIIAKNTNMLPAEIEKAFLQVSEKACLDIDPQLREAAAKGLLQNPANTPSTSVLMRQMVQGYVDQAVDTCNMVNTTMLEATRNVYLNGVQTAVNAATRKELTQTLEAGAFGVITGAETKTQAIRKAMNAITAQGITGFVDKAGRKWSAEAYTSMVIRTTAHNAAIQSVKTRQQEYGGGDIFQVSSHPAARPLCYPYQGKFFSWSTSGEFKDGAGHTHKYNIITDSSYGEPAGLFGINCGHHPIPMIPNFSYPQDGPTMDEEQNKKAYGETQQQREYERQIREAKRDLEIAKATGDEVAIKEAEQKVAQKQANMRAFTKETGRPRRYDREKIAGTKDIDGFKGYMAQFGSDIPLNKTTNTTPVTISNKILTTMRGNADEFVKTIEKAPQAIKTIYTKLSDNLKKVVNSSTGSGFFRNSTKELTYHINNKLTGGAKFKTFAHEFGHFIDDQIPEGFFEAKEVSGLYGVVGTHRKVAASASDEFLLALRTDKAHNERYLTDIAYRKDVIKELVQDLGERAGGVQDLFDGFFDTQASRDMDYHMPYGHGKRYWNRFYNDWIKNKYWNRSKEAQDYLSGLGYDVSSQAKVKSIVRDYETASELWAHLSSAMSVDPDMLTVFEKYAPNSVAAYTSMIERYANDIK